MIEAAVMTLPELEAAYVEAVDTSNWHHEDQNWTLAEWWHNRAVELGDALKRRRLQ